MRAAAICFLIGLSTTMPLTAQPVTDTLFTWRGYARVGQCRVAIYPTPPDEERKRTIVLRELASNQGPSTVDDVRYLAEAVGRHFQLDPTDAYWIFHWGSFSYAGAEADDKELFLRATFHRTSTGRLSSPYWRIIRRDEVLELTDRRFREPSAR